MAGRKLTDEEKQKSAQKPWKHPPKFTTNPSRLRNLQRLTGPKTPEGKMKVLNNLIVAQGAPIKHGGYVRSLLTVEEVEVYDFWRGRFEQEFADLNMSSDELILDQILMEKVIEMRLMKAKLEKPTLNIDRALADCQARMRKAMEDLGVSRRVRMQMNEPSVNSFAEFMLALSRKQRSLEEARATYEAEEEEFMRARRASAGEIPVEGEVIPDAETQATDERQEGSSDSPGVS